MSQARQTANLSWVLDDLVSRVDGIKQACHAADVHDASPARREQAARTRQRIRPLASPSMADRPLPEGQRHSVLLTPRAVVREPVRRFLGTGPIFGLLLIFRGSLDLVTSISAREINPAWWLGMIAGVLEILLGFWVSQQEFPARALLLVIWVGFFALFRGFSDVLLAFEVRGLQRKQAAVRASSTSPLCQATP